MQETGNSCYPESFLERITALGVGRNGQHVVEVGAARDAVARALTLRGARVTVVESDAGRLGNARRLARAANVVLDYHEDAGELDAGAWDAVIAHAPAQVNALGETARRLLRPGGLLAICGLHPLPDRDVVACTGDELIMKTKGGWDGKGDWAGPDQYWVSPAGFETAAMFQYRERLRFGREQWEARVVARGGIEELGEAAEAEFRKELARLLAVVAPGEEIEVLHLVSAHLFSPMDVSE